MKTSKIKYQLYASEKSSVKTHIFCINHENGEKRKIFGIGDNEYGELGTKCGYPYAYGSPNTLMTNNVYGSPGLSRVEEHGFIEILKGFNGDIKKICSGADHTIILTNNGIAYSIGDNSSGQLSTGNPYDKCWSIGLGCGEVINHTHNPQQITSFGKRKVVDVEVGNKFNVFILKDSIYSSGSNREGQLGIGEDHAQFIAVKMKFDRHRMKEIKCGNTYTLIMTKCGKLYKTGVIWKYMETTFVPTLIKQDENLNFSRIFTGQHCFFAISLSGKVYGMGWNRSSQLSHKLPETVKTLCSIPFLNGEGIKDIKCCIIHTTILSVSGKVYGIGKVFGHSQRGALAPIFPTLIMEDITQIECSKNSTILIDINGVAWMMGTWDTHIVYSDENFQQPIRKIPTLKNICFVEDVNVKERFFKSKMLKNSKWSVQIKTQI